MSLLRYARKYKYNVCAYMKVKSLHLCVRFFCVCAFNLEKVSLSVRQGDGKRV